MSLSDYPRVGDWLSVARGRLVLKTGKVDIGQRISTALVRIAQDELTLPWDRIDVSPVQTDMAPDEGITSGSNSIEQSGRIIRLATATLRDLLLAEAARRYGGTPADWTLADGALHGPGVNQPVDLLDLAADLSLDTAIDTEVGLSLPADRLPGPPMRGLRDMVAGRYVYVHDLDLPGMLHARVVHPPRAGMELVKIGDTADKLRAAGLHIVRDGSFLALAGPDEWQVTQAALRLAGACEWAGAELPESDAFAPLTPANAHRFGVTDGVPDADDVPPPLADPDFAQRYERPYTLHGSLAPSAALAEWKGGCLRIHSHSQGIYPLRESIADSLGLPPSQVVLTHVPGAGCYGHNGADDAAFEAALVALALPDRPILLKRTREDEHAWEPFGSAMAVEIAARLDGSGRISAWSAQAISGTHRGRPRPGPGRAGPARLLPNHRRDPAIGPAAAVPNLNRHGGLHRNLDPIYDFADKRLVKNLVDRLPHRTSALRCLGAAANVFALESFMDEIARAQGREPLELRLSHLGDCRGIEVLERLARAPGPAPGAAGGRGFAYAQYKNAMTRVGIRVDLEVDDRAEIHLKSAVIIADAGRVVDPEGLQAQLEGGFVQGASWALLEEVTWTRDGINSRDWESYPVIRFDKVPDIRVDIIDRPSQPSLGAGEASPGPAIAAIANALFDATGIRMRRLPFTAQAIRARALG